MRKDVKLGFAVGGVLLAVLIVYVSVMGRANRPANQPGANTSVVSSGSNAPQAPTDRPTDPFGAQPSNQTASNDQGKPADGLNWDALLASGPVASRTPEAASPVQPAPPAVPTPTPAPQDPAINNAGIRTFDPGAQDQARATSLSTPVAPAPTPTPTPKPAIKQHVVAQGETLSSISTALFGSPRFANAIAQANPSINPSRLKIGTKLNLPDVSATKSAAKVEDINVGKNEYRVAQGDNLYRISMKLYGRGDRAEKIYELNKDRIGSDRSKLKLNMVLKLPEAPTVASR